MCIMQMLSSVTLPLDKDGGQSVVCVYIYILSIYICIYAFPDGLRIRSLNTS